jgi:hypothetical protein
MSDEVEMTVIPPCDLCTDGTRARYDAKTNRGPWAYLCEMHFHTHGMGLGTGRGQRLVLATKGR